MLELKHIHKYYNPGTVNEMCLFEDFNLTVEQGDFVSVVGSNGSGKTSMLNILCGSIPVEAGQILMHGEDISRMKEYKRNRKIGRTILCSCMDMSCCFDPEECIRIRRLEPVLP